MKKIEFLCFLCLLFFYVTACSDSMSDKVEKLERSGVAESEEIRSGYAELSGLAKNYEVNLLLSLLGEDTLPKKEDGMEEDLENAATGTLDGMDKLGEYSGNIIDYVGDLDVEKIWGIYDSFVTKEENTEYTKFVTELSAEERISLCTLDFKYFYDNTEKCLYQVMLVSGLDVTEVYNSIWGSDGLIYSDLERGI